MDDVTDGDVTVQQTPFYIYIFICLCMCVHASMCVRACMQCTQQKPKFFCIRKWHSRWWLSSQEISGQNVISGKNSLTDCVSVLGLSRRQHYIRLTLFNLACQSTVASQGRCFQCSVDLKQILDDLQVDRDVAQWRRLTKYHCLHSTGIQNMFKEIVHD